MKHVHRRGEGRQRPRVGDEIGGVGEARVEAVQQGEDQLTVLHGVADVAKSVGVLLQLRGVGFDREITLSRGSELLVQDDSARLLVRLEQITDGCVEVAGGRSGAMARSRTPLEMEPYIQLRTQASG